MVHPTNNYMALTSSIRFRMVIVLAKGMVLIYVVKVLILLVIRFRTTHQRHTGQHIHE